jgi:hypothetical protein
MKAELLMFARWRHQLAVTTDAEQRMNLLREQQDVFRIIEKLIGWAGY